MKKLIFLFICIIAVHVAIGQGVGVGTTNPNPSAALDVSSSSQGMLVPRMTTAQRTSISTPATGLLVFDLTTNSFWFKGATTWVELVDLSNTVVQINGTNLYMGMVGNVGIGTNEPMSKLEVVTPSDSIGITHTNGDIRLSTRITDTSAVILTTTENPLTLQAGSSVTNLTLPPNGGVYIGSGSPPPMPGTTLHVEGNTSLIGLVGVGTESPTSKLDVKTTPSFPAMTLRDDNVTLNFVMNSDTAVINTVTASAIQLNANNGTSHLTIESGGMVGIGTSNPTARLSVVRGVSPDGTAAFLGTTNNSYFNKGANEDTYINGGKAGSNVLLNSAAGSGFVGIGTATPLQMLHVAGGGFFGGALGLGIVAPLFPLHFSAASGDKLALSGSPGAFFGFGIQPNLMQVIAPNSSAAIGFGTGSSNAFNEKMRLTGDGKLGIGTQNPLSKLDVNGDVNISGGLAVGLGVAIAGGLAVGGAVGIGIQTPDPSSILDLSSTNKGFLYPRMSSTQREAIASPAAGLTVYDNTTNSPWYHDGDTWKEMKPDTTSFTQLVFRNGPDMIYMGLTDKVGVGTNTPAYKLQVKTGANMDGISHTDGNVDIVTRVSNANGGSIGTKSSHNFELFANNGESQFVIEPNGNIGIGGIDDLFSTLTVQRDPGNLFGSMEIRGTNYPSVFYNGAAEHTYINGGKPNSNLILNGQSPDLGNVGIGTETPLLKLHVVGNVGLEGNVGIGGIDDLFSTLTVQRDPENLFGSMEIRGTNYPSVFYNGAAEHTYINGGKPNSNLILNGQSPDLGNVGIGTESPLQKLHVVGNVAVNGNVGIGTSTPNNKLDVAVVTRTGTHPGNLPLYVTGNIGTNTGGMEIRKTDATEGIGIGSNTIYATGAVQDLRMEAKGATGTAKIATNGVERMFVTGAGNVGIGNSTPNAPLQFANSSANRKVVLFELANNDIQFSGFGTGTSPNSIRYQLCDTIGNHTFFGGRTSTSKELMRIQGNGNIGIGIGTSATVNNKLDVAEFTRTNLGSHPTNLPLYVTGDIGTNTNGMEVRTSDATQGVGIGSTTVYATAALQDLGLEAKGATGRLKLSTNSLERMTVTGAGNVGIGTISPNAPLQFTSVEATRKIVLYEGGNNDNQFFGFGINASALRYQALGDHVFYTGINSTTSKEQMRMTFGGNLGIGISAPLASLEVARGTGGLGTMSLHGTTYPTNINEGTSEHTSIRGGKANSNVLINDLAGLGNVGIGTAVPLQKLHVEGSTYISQKLGIGNNLPNAPLQFGNATQNRKIVLYEGVPNNDHQYYGFGVNGSILRYQVSNPGDNHVFYAAAASGTSSNELMRIQGNGNVGINKSDPQNMLDIQSGIARTGTHAAGRALYVTGDIQASSNGVEFRHYNGTQGIGFGYNTIYAAGSDAVQNLGIKAKGTSGNVTLSTNETERLRVTGDGKVGIGVTNPGAMLEIARGTAANAPNGSLQVNGTTYASHFNYGTTEDTYIRGGKAGGKVIINEYGDQGNVGIGTNNPLQKLHVGGKLAVDNNVGIGNTDPHAPLQFNNADANRKIVLSEIDNNDHQFTGFGTSPEGLRYQVPFDESAHIFYAGNSIPGSTELMRIKGNGNVDVAGQIEVGYIVKVFTYDVPFLTSNTYSCNCDAGYKALGGGWSGPGLDIIGSYPGNGGSRWEVWANNYDPAFSHLLVVYATCARIGN